MATRPSLVRRAMGQINLNEVKKPHPCVNQPRKDGPPKIVGKARPPALNLLFGISSRPPREFSLTSAGTKKSAILAAAHRLVPRKLVIVYFLWCESPSQLVKDFVNVNISVGGIRIVEISDRPY